MKYFKREQLFVMNSNLAFTHTAGTKTNLLERQSLVTLRYTPCYNPFTYPHTLTPLPWFDKHSCNRGHGKGTNVFGR